MNNSLLFSQHVIIHLCSKYNILPRDLASLLHEYWWEVNDTLPLVSNPRYGNISLLNLPSLFFERISVIKSISWASELRDILPIICFKILPCYKPSWCKHNKSSHYYTYLHFPSACKCKQVPKNHTSWYNTCDTSAKPDQIIGAKIDILYQYHRFVLCFFLLNKNLKIKHVFMLKNERRNISYKRMSFELHQFLKSLVENKIYDFNAWYATNSSMTKQFLHLIEPIF